MNKKEKLKLEFGGRSNVRFSMAEFQAVQKESQKLCLSIPTLLKDAYFKRLPTKVFASKKDLQVVKGELNKIGNNLNQIAKKINSGFMSGWCDSLDKLIKEVEKLNNKISFGHGLH